MSASPALPGRLPVRRRTGAAHAPPVAAIDGRMTCNLWRSTAKPGGRSANERRATADKARLTSVNRRFTAPQSGSPANCQQGAADQRRSTANCPRLTAWRRWSPSRHLTMRCLCHAFGVGLQTAPFHPTARSPQPARTWEPSAGSGDPRTTRYFQVHLTMRY